MGKDKICRQYSLIVVGNRIRRVSYGGGKDEELPRATDKAYTEAMDYVERFENQTVWTETNKTRCDQGHPSPHPPGFGLQYNQNIHQS